MGHSDNDEDFELLPRKTIKHLANSQNQNVRRAYVLSQIAGEPPPVLQYQNTTGLLHIGCRTPAELRGDFVGPTRRTTAGRKVERYRPPRNVIQF